MTAAVMAAVTAANLKIQEDEQQETGGWDSPETVEESLDITPELVLIFVGPKYLNETLCGSL